MESHCAWLCNVGRQAIPTKQADQDVHCVVQPVQVARSDHAIVCIEYSHSPSNGLSQYVLSHRLVFYFHGHPVSDSIVYHHVEQRRWHKYALCCTPHSREGRPVEAVLPRNQLLTVPESVQESTHPSTRSITLQCNEQAVLVYLVPMCAVLSGISTGCPQINEKDSRGGI